MLQGIFWCTLSGRRQGLSFVAAFNTRMKIDNAYIIVLKGIPSRILHKKKVECFLTEKLKVEKD